MCDLHSRCLSMARNGPAGPVLRCLLMGVKRKSRAWRQTDTIDPYATLAAPPLSLVQSPIDSRSAHSRLENLNALDMSTGLACAPKSFSGSFDLNQRDLQCVAIFCGSLGATYLGDHR